MAITNPTPIEIYAGNYRKIQFTVVDGDAGDGSAKDLTGNSARFSMAKQKADGSYSRSAEVDKSTSGSEVTITDAANGVIEVELVEADTLTLKGTYHYELELVDGSGNTLVVSVGEVEVLVNVENA